MAVIEYFYSAYSAFAYLGSKRIAELAVGHTIIHRPVDLAKVVGQSGAQKFSDRSPAHRDYYFRREIQRWAEYRDAPVMVGRPTHHDKDVSLANCMLIAGIEEGLDVQPLAHAMLQSHWRDDSDLSQASLLSGLGKDLGLDADALLTAANTPAIRDIYAANTEEAIARSMFGSPTYFVDGDMFYGQDRLELVERALAKPFAGKWP
jgi:2-hydroxychromene-2-carboxylate isomerase